ncbi:MAG: glutathione peroxidase [Bdellovibrionales bacterium]|nr:glutathione peroxidase [Bdellovibrionales bacterium]
MTSTAAPATTGSTAATPSDLYSQQLTTIDGKPATLADYKGKTLLIVNTASKCGYTPQYDGLQNLYSNYKQKGFLVLGFPSNDFGGQEPGSNEEIKRFCQTKFNVDFPMFAKGSVKGEAKQPLFTFLTQNSPTKGEIKWNFEKFLVSPDGRIVGRFDSKVKPDDTALKAAIEKNLPK